MGDFPQSAYQALKPYPYCFLIKLKTMMEEAPTKYPLQLGHLRYLFPFKNKGGGFQCLTETLCESNE